MCVRVCVCVCKFSCVNNPLSYYQQRQVCNRYLTTLKDSHPNYLFIKEFTKKVAQHVHISSPWAHSGQTLSIPLNLYNIVYYCMYVYTRYIHTTCIYMHAYILNTYCTYIHECMHVSILHAYCILCTYACAVGPSSHMTCHMTSVHLHVISQEKEFQQFCQQFDQVKA